MKRRIASRCLAGLLTLILTVTTLGTSLVEASTGDIDAAIVGINTGTFGKAGRSRGIVLLKNEDRGCCHLQQSRLSVSLEAQQSIRIMAVPVPDRSSRIP